MQKEAGEALINEAVKGTQAVAGMLNTYKAGFVLRLKTQKGHPSFFG
ncbi:MAG: hypothetical protein GY749_47040 [Desulfobacteraceae bacterium]|nr:hypothetical protein [Desulfobacteraceae bacterium]